MIVENTQAAARPRRSSIIAVAALAVVLTGCGGNGKSDDAATTTGASTTAAATSSTEASTTAKAGSTGSTTTQAGTTDTTTTTSSPTSSTTVPPTTATTTTDGNGGGSVDPEELIASLKDAGIPIGESIIYDETNDPNKNLGRPGKYVAKGAWMDTRIDCPGEKKPGFPCGGDVEVFDDSAALDTRFEYLANFATAPVIGGYYMWKIPGAIVRVGYDLAATQSEEYANVLEGIAPGKVEQYKP